MLVRLWSAAALTRGARAQESTIGAAFLTQTVSVNDATVKFEIWRAPSRRAEQRSAAPEAARAARDTAGQERYHSLAPMYYRGAPQQRAASAARAHARRCCARAGAAAAIIVYDITNSDSFARAKSWVRVRPPDCLLARAGADCRLRTRCGSCSARETHRWSWR